MNDDRQFLRIDDNKLYLYTRMPEFGEDISKIELIMTKEIFKECYKKWILEEDNDNNNNK